MALITALSDTGGEEMKPIAAVDFETKKIEGRHIAFPPKPVGVAIYGDGITGRYLAWGHPSGNNSSIGEAKGFLRKIYKTHRIVFHNSSFDCEVGEVHLGLPFLPDDYEDTLFLAYLIDPRTDDLGLKPLAELYLGIKPNERDRLKEWIEKNFKCTKEVPWGAYISEAPAPLVKPYAIGDVTRTYKLYKKFRQELVRLDTKYPLEKGQQSMEQAYQRELRLMPTIVRMEKRGVLVDVNRLERDIPKWEKAQAELDRFIIQRLGGPRKVAKFAKDGEEFNIGSGNQLANALDAAGKVSHWITTAKGNRSTAKKNLEQVISDTKLLAALQQRNIYDTYIDTYGRKWLTANREGVVFPRINQVRNRESDESRSTGTRTGRLSYSDSWQAIPSPERRPFKELPNIRDYIIPRGRGRVIAVRDYTQQEYRILAHYENAALLARYLEDPTIDMHEEARQMIHALINVLYDRRPVKDTGFGIIYGLGLKALAAKLKLSEEEAKQLRKAYLAAIPGLKDLIDDIKERCGEDLPLRTWGGRLYWCEPPSFSKKFNKVMTYEYKMINVLIQGSAADCTKEAMIRADEALPKDTPLLLQVHDELSIDVAKSRLNKDMRILREAMESVEFDVLMLSDGKTSARSWGQVKTYNDRR